MIHLGRIPLLRSARGSRAPFDGSSNGSRTQPRRALCSSIASCIARDARVFGEPPKQHASGVRSPDEQRSPCPISRPVRCWTATSFCARGLHSREYFQCALLLQRTDIAAKVCGWLADKVRQFDCDAVISPALGGIIVGQEVGVTVRQTPHLCREGRRQICCAAVFRFHRMKNLLSLRTSSPAAAACRRTISIVHAHDGVVSAVGVIVDRQRNAAFRAAHL